MMVQVSAEVGGRFAIPDGFVAGALREGDTCSHHVQLVLKTEIHGRKNSMARCVAKRKNEGSAGKAPPREKR